MRRVRVDGGECGLALCGAGSMKQPSGQAARSKQSYRHREYRKRPTISQSSWRTEKVQKKKVTRNKKTNEPFLMVDEISWLRRRQNNTVKKKNV